MINGIINVYKETGYTSFDVVAKLRRILKQKKIGHTGTLDPNACGVLPVCLGNATKVCDLLTDKDKVYRTTMLLGTTTDTQDITGEVLETKAVSVTEEDINKAVTSFIGEYDQVPPMYSALKVNGQKLCDLARKGIEVERKARRIKIYDIEIENIDIPNVTMTVKCSKGTYIRTLCDDIGKKLGTGACVKTLERTEVSVFKKEKAVTLSEIEAFSEEELNEHIMMVDCLFEDLGVIVVNEEGEKFLFNGNKLNDENFSERKVGNNTGLYKVYSKDKVFTGIYEWIREENLYKPVKMFL